MPRKRATKTKATSMVKIQEPEEKDFTEMEEKELLDQLEIQLSYFDNRGNTHLLLLR